MKNYSFLILSVFCFFLVETLISQTVPPEVNGNLYSLSVGNLVFEVDAEHGAKVSSLTIDGDEFMVTSDVSPGFLWGSTLWPAPQGEMGWPPPELLDGGEYSASIDGNVINLESQIDMDANDMEFQFLKSFWADVADSSISIRYSIVNKSGSSITKALWELTRVPVGGLTFWPTGPGGVWGALSGAVDAYTDYSWYDLEEEDGSGLKFFADNGGIWLAHVDEENRLFIKSFTEDVAPTDFADDEGEVELWIDGVYIELENLSAAVALGDEEILHYDVKWYLRNLPNDISAHVGNAELVQYVESIVEGLGLSSPEHQLSQNLKVSVFPNPTNQYLNFHFSGGNIQNYTVEIIDVMGKRLLVSEISDASRIDISELVPGAYLYSIVYEGSVFSGKVLKE